MEDAVNAEVGASLEDVFDDWSDPQDISGELDWVGSSGTVGSGIFNFCRLSRCCDEGRTSALKTYSSLEIVFCLTFGMPQVSL